MNSVLVSSLMKTSNVKVLPGGWMGGIPHQLKVLKMSPHKPKSPHHLMVGFQAVFEVRFCNFPVFKEGGRPAKILQKTLNDLTSKGMKTMHWPSQIPQIGDLMKSNKNTFISKILNSFLDLLYNQNKRRLHAS